MLSPAITGQPPMGAGGPMSGKIGRQGDMASASASVQKAIQILQMELPNLPTGSKAHQAVMHAVTQLAKNFPAGQAPPGPGDTALKNLAAQQQQGGGMQAIMKMLGPALGGGLAGAGAPGASPAPAGAA